MRKFNKDERYVPSKRYLHAKALLETYNSALDELDKYDEVHCWGRLNMELILNNIRDNELKSFIPQYTVNEKALEVEIIFTQQENTAMDDMVEILLNKCLVK